MPRASTTVARRARAALLVEDRFQQLIIWLLRRLGRPVRAQTYPSWGAAGLFHVRGRVLLGSTKAAEPAGRVTTWSSLRANLAPFLTAEVPHAVVRVTLGGLDQVVLTDREGYVHADLEGADLAPGQHTVTLTPVDPAGEAAVGVVHVLDPSADVVVVSDIDDTIIDSGIAQGAWATVRTALLSQSGSRVPLEGAPALYRSLAGRGRPFLYLSTSPWNLLQFLQRFLEQHGFPPGPLLLTDWGPGAGSLLRVSSRQHKLTALRELAVALPAPAFVLVGDSGQQDPEIYTAFAEEHPGRVAAVYIRLAGPPTPARSRELDACAQAVLQAGVPFVLAEDSAAMLRHAVSAGLV